MNVKIFLWYRHLHSTLNPHICILYRSWISNLFYREIGMLGDFEYNYDPIGKMLIWVIFYCLSGCRFVTLYTELHFWVTFCCLSGCRFVTLYAELHFWVTFYCLSGCRFVTLYTELHFWVIFCCLIAYKYKLWPYFATKPIKVINYKKIYMLNKT